MVPFEPTSAPDLAGTAVFIGAGRADRIAPPGQAERLAELLRQAGAKVTVHWEPGGHALTETEVRAAREWIAKLATAGTVERAPMLDGKKMTALIMPNKSAGKPKPKAVPEDGPRK